MDPITGLLASQAVQGVTDVVQQVTSSDEQTNDSSFEAYMRGVLTPDAGNNINEEELFAAILQQRIAAIKGEEAGKEFEELFNGHKDSMRRGDGYVPVESAANAALNDLEENGTLSSAESDQIYSEAFSAAQLDDNHDVLWDGRGSGNDPSIAIAEMESALLAAKAIIENIDSGAATANTNSSGTTESSSNTGTNTENTTESTTTENTSSTTESTTNSTENTSEPGEVVNFAGTGFLWKPVSDTTDKLVVLLPASYAQEVESLVLKDENDKKIEEGKSSGYANGGREHFRFDKAGEDYPDNLTVEVTMKDGSVKIFQIGDTSQRHE